MMKIVYKACGNRLRDVGTENIKITTTQFLIPIVNISVIYSRTNKWPFIFFIRMIRRKVVNASLGALCQPAYSQNMGFSKSKEFIKLNKVLLLQKLSRLEIERLRHPDLNEDELKRVICNRGSSYDTMLKYHEINRKFQLATFQAFEKKGIETKTVNRFNYNESNIEWCDAVFPIGGDGTFLLAANKITSRNKPVIGLNSDPSRSEGHLCLPKKYSLDIDQALNQLLMGNFRWMFRSRIRITLTGGNINDSPVELHEQALRFKIRDLGADERRKQDNDTLKCREPRVLPVLALNEVFLGESLSAKVSYFEVKINGSEDSTHLKSSGLLVCTGTGSTSWHLSMNRFNEDDVRQLLELYGGQSKSTINTSLIPKVCDQFNNRFIFSPENGKLGYTVRDLIYAGVWPKPKGKLPARGFASGMEIKSRCSDAGLVIDGGISFPFNDGTKALLEARAEDALRTVIIVDK